MVVADVIALFVVLGLFGLGGKTIFSVLNQARMRHQERVVDHDRMRNELRAALNSGDYKQLENFLVIWGDDLHNDMRDIIKQRINELISERGV
jgi:hypothetical protein